MSKRSLIIIIILLLVADVVATFWYVAERFESEGRSSDFFERHDSTTLAADTSVVVSSLPDTFQLSEHHVYHQAVAPISSHNPNTYYTSVARIKLRWPTSINGNDELAELEHALTRAAFGANYVNLTSAIGSELAVPQFNTMATVDFKQVEQMPNYHNEYGHAVTTLVYPLLTSFRLLVMEIDVYEFNGVSERHHSNYVHYDRFNQRVLGRGDIFLAGDNTDILNLINHKISALNSERNLNLLSASKVPNQFCCKRTGVLFEFSDGELTDGNRGTIEVLVPYDEIKPHLTKSFKQLLSSNGGYWNYKPLEP